MGCSKSRPAADPAARPAWVHRDFNRSLRLASAVVVRHPRVAIESPIPDTHSGRKWSGSHSDAN